MPWRFSSMVYEEYLLKYNTNKDNFKRYSWPLFAVVQVFLCLLLRWYVSGENV